MRMILNRAWRRVLQDLSVQKQRTLSTATASSTPFSSTYDFPSLRIGSRQLQPLGSFAEAQAVFLDPDPVAVEQLTQALVDTRTGVVAHYYMDVELQGVLQAVKKALPNRVGIADSLRMGDMAVEMCTSDNTPAEAIACWFAIVNDFHRSESPLPLILK